MYEVSLIIPVYNVENYVKDSLRSALVQDFRSIEYVIIDDCSTDNSMNVVRETINASARKGDIYIYKQPQNRGLSEARNLGLKNATGKYIMFMDSDDELIPQCVSLHYDRITSKLSDFTVSNTMLVGAKSIHIHPIPKDVETTEPILSFYRRDWSTSAWNKLYRADFLRLNNLKFVGGILHEDWLWSHSVASKAKSIALVEEYTYIYKIRAGSITTSNSDLKITSMLYVLDKIRNSENSHCDAGEKFLSFFKFNTALYILCYKGRIAKRKYYNDMRRYKITSPPRQLKPLMYWALTKLPFALFYAMVKPPYVLYKLYVRW